VLAALLLDPDRGGGAMMLAVTVAYVVVSVNRAFIGDVLLAQASRHDGDDRDRLVRHGAAAALIVAVAAVLVLAGVGAIWQGQTRSVALLRCRRAVSR
jgi:hypothetical protein